jgi:hypothetical protein
MAFTSNGDLEIRANSLSLTGQLGGVNLLKQTSPKRTLPLVQVIKTITKDNEENESYSYNVTPITDTNGFPLCNWDVAKRNTYNDYVKYCLSYGYESIDYISKKDFDADTESGRTIYYLSPSTNKYVPTSSWVSGRDYFV